ncbi:hypothetical protein [Paraburkholderia hospita]|uniref:hypothetical protein n=1 Tax=Paraburkholderia hospita TaxID=169430 RepID=UPI000B346966|nr:hypothetical protein [Paraburkholderia hospita]OUL84861.1 hypothetical protein CA603_24210 [Paraburkholderia hospita]
MQAPEKSLRGLVDKWLAPTHAMRTRVIRFSRLSLHRQRYVCVETSGPMGTLALFFFRHDDGSWRVYPPEAQRPAMAPRL